MTRRRIATVVVAVVVALSLASVVLHVHLSGSSSGHRNPGIPERTPPVESDGKAPTVAPAVCAAPPAAPARTARAAPQQTVNRTDFNGDGFPDIHLDAWYRPKEGGGWLHHRAVVPGSARGIAPAAGVSLSLPGLDPATSTRPLVANSGAHLTGDLDSDGLADLVVQNLATDHERPWTRQSIVWGSRKGTPHMVRLPAEYPLFAATGDFDGDGALDLIGLRDGREVRPPGFHEPGHSACLTILYGPFTRTGAPRRTVAVEATQGGYVGVSTLVTGDFDGDGRDDVVTRGGLPVPPEDQAVSDWYDEDRLPRGLVDTRYYRGTPAGPAVASLSTRVGRALPLPGRDRTTLLLTAGNLDGDRFTDIVQTDGTILHGGPHGPGARTSRLPAPYDTGGEDPRGTLRTIAYTGGPVLADLNGDGQDDLVNRDSRSKPAGTVTVLLSQPNGGYAPPLTIDRYRLDLPSRPSHSADADNFGWDVAAADLDDDGRAELLVGYRGFFKPREEHVYWVFPGTADGPGIKKARLVPVRELGTR
ncbi:VCBS repeat-containing protein [Streptomyces sp. NBC_00878]|uniref:FG-GAP repeat domain-containing protein n=1 Tax=Streptomyces sp. NBC_00878 TaxID=2975854 RepID=UPI002255D259|nr:VCBS repeat-containing protein [Streptomyces sp. NBC_00878]MCX4906229.1 VCBS repeat-containing protein [Streptomyces sp. NBC_00878]